MRNARAERFTGPLEPSALGKTWQREVDVPVHENGLFSDSFSLPMTFVAVYDVVATGLESAGDLPRGRPAPAEADRRSGGTADPAR